MTPADFWPQLEYRLTRELHAHPASRHLWCDGFLPDPLPYTPPHPALTGTAWIAQGSHSQHPWRFQLLLPHPIATENELRWPSLLPPEQVHGWLTLDHAHHALTLDMSFRHFFLSVVQSASHLPADLLAHAANARTELRPFDDTYIEFLDTQIRLSPCGPELTEILTRRRTALSPFTNTPLINGTIDSSTHFYFLRIDPATQKIIHWESFEK